MIGMAASDPAHGEPKSLERAVAVDCCVRILGATREKAALRCEQRPDRILIDPQQKQEERPHGRARFRGLPAARRFRRPPATAPRRGRRGEDATRCRTRALRADVSGRARAAGAEADCGPPRGPVAGCRSRSRRARAVAQPERRTVARASSQGDDRYETSGQTHWHRAVGSDASRGAPCTSGPSDDEPGAALRAARSEHLATADRAHSGAKTVGALAPYHGGLERTFHGSACWEKALY